MFMKKRKIHTILLFSGCVIHHFQHLNHFTLDHEFRRLNSRKEVLFKKNATFLLRKIFLKRKLKKKQNKKLFYVGVLY